MNDIKRLLKGKKVYISDEMGFDSSFIESSAFGFISIRTLKNYPRHFQKPLDVKKNYVVKFFNLNLIIFTIGFNFIYYFYFAVSKKNGQMIL